MIAKKSRTHSCGQSNIDFRSLKDEENLKKFQPWKIKKDFGTMGYTDFHLPRQAYKELMRPTSKLNNLQNKNKETPNPKLYDTAVFYNTQKLNFRKDNLDCSDKIAELDESLKGKERFTGDSMMIAQIAKIRRNKAYWFKKSEKFEKGIVNNLIKLNF